jgi:hypothetical protein
VRRGAEAGALNSAARDVDAREVEGVRVSDSAALAATGGAGLVVLGVLLVAVAALVRSGSLERNSLLGLRTPATMATDGSWRAGHVAAEPLMRWGGVLTLLLGVAPGVVVWVLGSARSDRDPALVPSMVGGAYVLAVGLVVAAGVRAHRAALRHLVEHR